MGAPAGFGSVNDGRDVVGVAIDGDAAFDDVEGKAFSFEVAIVDGDEGGELGAGGVAHDEHSCGVAAVLGDVVVDPAEGFGDVAEDGDHLDVGQNAVAGGDKDEAFVGEGLGLGLDAGFVAGDPAAAVDPENDGEVVRALWRIDVELLAGVGVFDVGDVAFGDEGRGLGDVGWNEEEE